MAKKWRNNKNAKSLIENSKVKNQLSTYTIENINYAQELLSNINSLAGCRGQFIFQDLLSQDANTSIYDKFLRKMN